LILNAKVVLSAIRNLAYATVQSPQLPTLTSWHQKTGLQPLKTLKKS
jgi:hypothetical protein